MAHKFDIGDRVRIIDVVYRDRVGHLVGTVTTVIDYDQGDNTYELDIPAPDPSRRWPNVWAEPQNIEPFYDGNDKVAWSDCVWQPNCLRVC